MNHQDGTIRELVWQEVCPWLILVRALRLALGLRVLILATIGLVATTAGWRVVGGFFENSTDAPLPMWIEADSHWPWQKGDATENLAGAGNEGDGTTPWPRISTDAAWLSTYATSWFYLARPFIRLFDPSGSWWTTFYSLLNGMWAILVWSMFGGAISRIAALELTRRERLGLRAAITQTLGRFSSYVAAPLLPLALIVLFAVPLAAVGLATRLSFVAWLVGLAWCLVLLLGFVLAVLAIGFCLGWPFLWATISVERTDAFDALSRAYAYVYQRPLRLIFYLAVSAVLAAMGGFAIHLFTSTSVAMSDWGIAWGSGNDAMEQLRQPTTSPREAVPEEAEGDTLPDSATPSTEAIETRPAAEITTDAMIRGAATFRRFWLHSAHAIGAGYAAGFVWVSAVGMYLLLRRDIDATEMDEITLEDQDHLYGLPSLEQHPSGVPGVEESERTEESPS